MSYALYGDLLNWETLFIVYGKVEEAFDVYTVTISKLESLQRLFKVNLKKGNEETSLPVGKKALSA